MLEILKLIPPKYRAWAYALIGLASFALGVWRASDGHWLDFLYTLVVSAGSATATANVDKTGVTGDGQSSGSK